MPPRGSRRAACLWRSCRKGPEKRGFCSLKTSSRSILATTQTPTVEQENSCSEVIFTVSQLARRSTSKLSNSVQRDSSAFEKRKKWKMSEIIHSMVGIRNKCHNLQRTFKNHRKTTSSSFYCESNSKVNRYVKTKARATRTCGNQVEHLEHPKMHYNSLLIAIKLYTTLINRYRNMLKTPKSQKSTP